MKISQPAFPDFMRRSARAAKRAAISLVAAGLLIDVFAGFGGGSIASERAHGRPVNIAINHWPTAIEFHERNHPLPTRHFTADVWDVDPEEAVQGQPVLHAHFSPDCRHFSSAKGGQPVSDGVRALAWIVLRWAKTTRPTLITLENVKEFLTWGPTIPLVKNGKAQHWPNGDVKRVPDPAKKGVTFKIWLGRLKAMGYEVDWKLLDAAAYGAPTHRKRLFLVARCDGKPVVWPAATHGPGLKPFRTAAECIDFSRPCPSIFMTREDARQFKKATGIQCQRPLRRKTLWRVANGIKRYVIEAAKPFIIGPGGREGQSEPRDASRPLSTITTKNDKAIVAPTMAKFYSTGCEGGAPVSEPMHTITSKDRFGLIAANMVRANHGGEEFRGQTLDQPLGAVTTKHGMGVSASHLVKFRGDSEGTAADAPMPTVTAGQGSARPAGAAHALGLSSAALVEVQNASGDNGARDVQRPMHTVTAWPKGGGMAMAQAILKHYGGVTGQEVEKPLGTITSIDHHGIAAAHLTHFHSDKAGEVRASEVTDPLPTQDTSNRFGFVAACLTKFYGTAIGADLLKPLSTVTANAGGGHLGAVHAYLSAGVDEAAMAGFWRVYAFLIEHLGTDAPLPLVQSDGHLYLIVDIGLRMLEPRELLNAQFTPELAAEYVLPQNKSVAVKLIGNSVSPPVLEAVIRAQKIGRKARAA